MIRRLNMIDEHKSLNIAIIGLSLNKLNSLKEYIRSITPLEYEIYWSAITQPNIDLLMIDSYFYDAPSIQKVISYQKAHVLKLITDAELSGLLQDKNLYLPAESSSMFKNWLEENIFATPPTSNSEDNKNNIEVVAQNHSHIDTLDHKNTGLEIFKELLNPQHGKIFIFDKDATLGIADTRKELIWLTAPDSKLSLSTDYSLNYTHAKANEVSTLHAIQPKDLRQWLWSLIWQSSSFQNLVNQSDFIKLDFWPQPDESNDRRDILKMAACFQQGAQISQVASHLNISVDRVCLFASACMGAGLAQKVKNEQAAFRSKIPATTAETTGLRGFFGKLRQRLGI